MRLVLGLFLAAGTAAAQEQEVVTLLPEGPFLETALPIEMTFGEPTAEGLTVLAEWKEVVARETVSPEIIEEASSHAADGLRVQDLTEPTAEGLTVSAEWEEVVARETVSPEIIEEASSHAADGLRVQDFTLEEMPRHFSSGKWFSSGQWYGSAEVLMMNRSRNYRRVLGYDPTVVGINPPIQNNLAGTFVTTGVPWDLVPGTRLTLGEHLGRDDLDRDQSLEFTYYGGLSFFVRDSYNAMPNSFLVTPLAGTILPGLPGFTGAQTYEATINSIYNSMEINYKLDRRLGRDQLVMSPNGSWTRHAERGWLPAFLIGTRLANVNEAFTFDSRRTNVSTSKFSGNYDIQTQNWLWGLNLGGELISQNESYYWGLRGRVTPAISFAANQQQAAGVNTLPPPPTVARNSFGWRQAAEQIGPGFIGDLTLLGGWQVTPNFAVQVGYDFLWVAGIATATRQFNLDNVRPNSIDGGGQILYNGLSMGVEGSW